MRFPEKKIRDIFEDLYTTYNASFIWSDPLSFVYRYDDKKDKEIVAFIAALFAYGKVSLIQRNIEYILSRMGKSPYGFICSYNKKEGQAIFKGYRYRFNNEEDLGLLILLLQRIIQEYGSVSIFFLRGYKEDDTTIKNSLIEFVGNIYTILNNIGGLSNTKGMGFLIPDPRNGSACKRLNLFLRWMVRNDSIDTGIWKEISPSKLIIPLDTHIARLSRLIGLTANKSANWNMAADITESLKILDPSDPIKYDFSLCRLGILDHCPKRFNINKCRTCQIKEICLL